MPSLTQTTLSAAVDAKTTIFPLVSVTGISAPGLGTVGTQLYVVDPGQSIGEAVTVVAINGLNVTVTRSGPNFVNSHSSGAMVLAGPPNAFAAFDPTGATNNTAYTPWVNYLTGNQWLYSSITGTWVPGFGNFWAQRQVTAAVASAATILPTGPLFHITGTAAIVNITVPVGGVGQDFSVFPDAIFTWTAAGNIAVAGTAVVNRLLTFRYDYTTGKYIPSYV